ncbi:hypothetical protein ACNF40_06600 [Cuniculiplasma sp. SKW4]|uniref:hypothetical protein n=1 Tax=Cuniculiplasma sp. SKW4 TaxID=3400171 RepID=UPI003FCFB0AA
MSKAILTSLESYQVDIPDEFSFKFKKEDGDTFSLTWKEECLNDTVAKNTMRAIKEKLDRAKMLNLVDDSTHYRMDLRKTTIQLVITGTRKTLIESLFREIVTQAKLVLSNEEIDRIVGSMEVVRYE